VQSHTANNRLKQKQWEIQNLPIIRWETSIFVQNTVNSIIAVPTYIAQISFEVFLRRARLYNFIHSNVLFFNRIFFLPTSCTRLQYASRHCLAYFYNDIVVGRIDECDLSVGSGLAQCVENVKSNLRYGVPVALPLLHCGKGVAAVRVGVDEAAAMYTRCNRFGGEGGGKKYPLAVALTPNFPVPPLTSRLWSEKTRRRSRLKNRARICAAADSLGHDKWVRRKVFAPIYTPTQTVIIISCVCVCVVASRQFAVEKKKKLSVGIACDYCVYGSMNHTDL